MKPWERALAREPMCAFVEAVVDGYSPLDKHLCKLARAGAALRALPWWTTVPVCKVAGVVLPRGQVWTREGKGCIAWTTDKAHGEITWR